MLLTITTSFLKTSINNKSVIHDYCILPRNCFIINSLKRVVRAGPRSSAHSGVVTREDGKEKPISNPPNWLRRGIKNSTTWFLYNSAIVTLKAIAKKQK